MGIPNFINLYSLWMIYYNCHVSIQLFSHYSPIFIHIHPLVNLPHSEKSLVASPPKSRQIWKQCHQSSQPPPARSAKEAWLHPSTPASVAGWAGTRPSRAAPNQTSSKTTILKPYPASVPKMLEHHPWTNVFVAGAVNVRKGHLWRHRSNSRL